MYSLHTNYPLTGLEEGTWDWSGKTYEVPGEDLDFCNRGSR